MTPQPPGFGGILGLGMKLGRLLVDCGREGWDSYGAAALTPDAARAALDNLAAHMVPTVNGGLEFEWDCTDVGPLGRSGLIVEFGPDGSLVGFYASNGHDDTEWEATAAEPTPTTTEPAAYEP